MRPLVFAALILGASRAAIASPEFWRGHAGNQTNGMTIELRIDPPSAGSITLLELAAREIPLQNVHRSAERLELELEIEKSVMRFHADVRGDTANGTYEMGPMRGDFQLTRIQPPPLPYEEREVRFNSGDVKLAGTLLMPKRGGRLPAAIFLHGSGPMTRDGNRFLADRLARRGVAALIYDKRGSGASTGDLASSDYDDLAADAAAAFDFLKTQPQIDAARIGFAGASQAGWIGTMAATQRPAAFLAFTSAPAVNVATEGWWDYESLLHEKGFSESDIAAARRISELDDEVTRGHTSWETLAAAVEEVKQTPWFKATKFELLPADHPSRAAYRRVIDLDPLPLLQKIDAPVLWIYAGRDTTVPVDWSLANLLSLIKAGKDYTIRVFPAANHALVEMPADLANGGWPRRVPQHAGVVTDWIVQRVNPTPR